MVIGNGLLAKSFNGYGSLDAFLIFASGVSNSKSCGEEDFGRERRLLEDAIKNNPAKKIVYFSSSSVDDPDLAGTPYIRHKADMEALIRAQAPAYHIFRLPNLAGASANPNTILNFLYSCIENGRSFELWKFSERNIIDIADVFRAIDHVLKNNLFLNLVINVANEKNYPLAYIVECIEAHCHKKGVFVEKEKGEKFNIDISDIRPIYRMLKIDFGENYLPQLLEKYYPKK